MATGSVNKDKKTGTWYYVLELGKDANGKRKQKKKRGFKLKSEAQRALTQALSEVQKGMFIEVPKRSLREFWEEWFEGKKLSVGIQTAKVYEGYLNVHIIPYFGNLQLNQLKTAHIQSFVNELCKKEYAFGTIKKAYNIISNSLEYAYDQELIPKNYAKKVRLPKHVKDTEITVWDKDEASKFLRAALDDRYYLLFYLALATGMRQGELLGLRWRDVNMEQNWLRVTQTLSHDGKKFLAGAKSRASIRTIPVHEEVITKLRKHHALVMKEKQEFGEDYADNDLVICTKIGTPVNPANIRRTFERLIKRAEVPRIRFHDLRHTHATHLMEGGHNIKVVAERLGHIDTRVTLDTYSHVSPAMQQGVLTTIANLLD